MYRTQKKKKKVNCCGLELRLLWICREMTWCAGLAAGEHPCLTYPDLNLSAEYDVPLDAAAYLLLHFCCNRGLLLPRLFPFND